MCVCVLHKRMHCVMGGNIRTPEIEFSVKRVGNVQKKKIRILHALWEIKKPPRFRRACVVQCMFAVQ